MSGVTLFSPSFDFVLEGSLEYFNISVTVVLQPLLPSSPIARRGPQGTREGPLLWLSNNPPYCGQGKPNRLRRGSSVNDYFLVFLDEPIQSAAVFRYGNRQWLRLCLGLRVGVCREGISDFAREIAGA